MTIDARQRARRLRNMLAAALLSVAPAITSLGWVAVTPSVAGAAGGPVTWTALHTAKSPPARQGASMAYDASSDQLVLFGGQSATGALLGDTWVYANGTWTELCATGCGPSPATGTSMAFDPKLNQLVLFGGQTALNPSRFSDATWTWNGRQWYRPPTANQQPPPGRAEAAMAADDSGPQGSIVLFGGSATQPTPFGLPSLVPGAGGGTTTTLSDTWTWDGSAWSQQLPAQSPSSRSGAAATWDPAAGAVLLFGGTPGGLGGWLDDTWVWRSDTWTPVPLATPPSARANASLAYQATLGSVMLYGGQGATGATNDTWMISGLAWRPVLTGSAPVARSAAAAAEDSSTGAVVLFGGAGPFGLVYDDTEALAAPGSSSPTSPTSTSTTNGTPSSTAPASRASAPSTGAPSTTNVGTGSVPAQPQSLGPLTGSASLHVTSERVRDGENVTLSGSGFARSATISVIFRSKPVREPDVTADAQGAFSDTVSVPKGASAGLHHFEATGAIANGGLKTLESPVLVVGSQLGHHGPAAYVIGAMVSLAVLIPIVTWLVLDRMARVRQSVA
jgi:hypothetical protein